MEFTAAQIAEWIEGEIIGDAQTKVSDFGKIEDAGENALTFLANIKYQEYLPDSKASLIVVSRDIPFTANGKTYIIVDDAYKAMTHLLSMYANMQNEKSGIEQPSFVSDKTSVPDDIYIGAFAYIGAQVKIGKNCKIYPHVYIDDNVTIGDNTTIYAGAKIYKDCVIGNQCTIHAGTIIGSDGFGFQPDKNGVYHKVPQIGNVVIEDDVEIGSNCTIDRATMGSTRIEQGVKLDNLIQIAHNAVIGKNTVIASQTGVAGSTKIGKNNIIGGQVGIAGHLTLGDNIQIQAQSGLNNDVPDNSKLYGSPALDAMEFRKAYVYFRKLPELMRKLNQLEKKLNQEKSNG